MRNVFHMISRNFFNLLASNSNQDIFVEALLTIYHVYDREISYKIERESVKSALVVLILDEHLMDRQEEELKSTPNEFANSILRKMMDSGWIEEETDSATYEKSIIMTEAGIMLAEFLMQVVKPEKEEYASYIYNIYNTLQREEQWKDDPYIHAVKNVYRNSKQLAKSLKKLSTTIKTVIERMVKEESLESLTQNLLDYCEGSFIKEYARLTKQQNIHVYRTYIRQKLDQFLNHEEQRELVVIGCAMEEELEESEAEEYVFEMISRTKEFLTEDYDRIMSGIKKKIILYLNLAIGRAKFLLNHEVNTRGYVEQTLRFLIQDMNECGLKEELPREMGELFRLYTHEFMDTASIRFPRKQREIKDTYITQVEIMTEEQIDRAKELQRKEAYNPYDKKQMKKLVETLLNGKKQISAMDFPLEVKADMLMALSSVVYGKENGFTVEVHPDYIERNGIRLHNFTIKREPQG